MLFNQQPVQILSSVTVPFSLSSDLRESHRQLHSYRPVSIAPLNISRVHRAVFLLYYACVLYFTSCFLSAHLFVTHFHMFLWHTSHAHGRVYPLVCAHVLRFCAGTVHCSVNWLFRLWSHATPTLQTFSPDEFERVTSPTAIVTILL